MLVVFKVLRTTCLIQRVGRSMGYLVLPSVSTAFKFIFIDIIEHRESACDMVEPYLSAVSPNGATSALVRLQKLKEQAHITWFAGFSTANFTVASGEVTAGEGDERVTELSQRGHDSDKSATSSLSSTDSHWQARSSRTGPVFSINFITDSIHQPRAADLVYTVVAHLKNVKSGGENSYLGYKVPLRICPFSNISQKGKYQALMFCKSLLVDHSVSFCKCAWTNKEPSQHRKLNYLETSERFPSQRMQSGSSDSSSWLPPFESRNPRAIVDDWYKSLYIDRSSSPPLGQPSSSVPQDLGTSESAGWRKRSFNDHSMTYAGGSGDPVNFDASLRLTQPQSTLPDAALRMSNWPQGQTSMMMRSGQPVVVGTPLPSSFRSTSNSDLQQSLLLQSQAPVPGTSRSASKTPLPSAFSNLQHFDFHHLMSAPQSQSQASMGTRHTVSDIQSLPSFSVPNSHFNTSDQPIASSSRIAPPPVFPEMTHTQFSHPRPSLEWTTPLGASALKFEAPPGLPYDFDFQNIQAPVSNSSSNVEPQPLPSFTSAQELNIRDAGSDGPLAGSSGRRTTETQRYRPSPLPGRSNEEIATIQDTVTQKIGHIRRANSNYKKHALKPMKIIQFKPAVAAELPRYTEPVLQSIIDASAAIENIKSCSQRHMSMLTFERGFFLAEGLVTVMIDEVLDAQADIARCPDGKYIGNLQRWKTSQDGTSHIAKLKGTSKMIWTDFEKTADIFALPAYSLSLNPAHNKEEMTASRIARIEILLTDFAYLDAWVKASRSPSNFLALLILFQLFNNDTGELRWFCIPFGHGAVLALIEHVLTVLKYFRSIAFGEKGWQKRLQNAIAVISTVYRSALLKLKGGSGWIEAGAPDEVQYLLFVERVSSLTSNAEWMFKQMLDGLCRAYSP
ncbi:hypothetical protein EDD22DRAFT_853040 [Suillus occidentalis]|nr:hypothetical protein EDD22DRAFT_853040 [Suillus occidentalis]